MKKFFFLILILTYLSSFSQSEHAKLLFPNDENAQHIFDFLKSKKEDKEAVKQIKKYFKKNLNDFEYSKKNPLRFRGYKNGNFYELNSLEKRLYRYSSYNINSVYNYSFFHINYTNEDAKYFESLVKKKEFSKINNYEYLKNYKRKDKEAIKKREVLRYQYIPLNLLVIIDKRFNNKVKITIDRSDFNKNGILKNHNKVRKKREEEAKKRRAKDFEYSTHKDLADELLNIVTEKPYSIDNNTNIDFSNPYYPKTKGSLASQLIIYKNIVFQKSKTRNQIPYTTGAGFFITKNETQISLLKKLRNISKSSFNFKNNNIFAISGEAVSDTYKNIKTVYFDNGNISIINTKDLGKDNPIYFKDYFKPNTTLKAYLVQQDKLWKTEFTFNTNNTIDSSKKLTVTLNKEFKFVNTELPKNTKILFNNPNDYKTLQTRSKNNVKIEFSGKNVSILLPNNSKITGDFYLKDEYSSTYPEGIHLYTLNNKTYKNDYRSYWVSKYLIKYKIFRCIVESNTIDKKSKKVNFYNFDNNDVIIKSEAVNYQKKLDDKKRKAIEKEMLAEQRKQDALSAQIMNRGNNKKANDIFRDKSKSYDKEKELDKTFGKWKNVIVRNKCDKPFTQKLENSNIRYGVVRLNISSYGKETIMVKRSLNISKVTMPKCLTLSYK